jgi:D-serine deaminase-like pyridoxal phosphate-dependent protein
MAATAQAPAVFASAQAPLSEIPTPFALIDGRVLQDNIARVQDAVTATGASLRPHFKTHRTLEIAQRQLAAGASGLTVATAAQLARVTERLACPVLVSSPIQLDSATAPGLRAALSHGEVAFAIESERSVERLRSALGPGVAADVVIEVEVGCRRTGIAPSQCGALARRASGQGLRVVGLFSYPGQGYLPGEAAAAAELELAALAHGASSLRRAGVAPRHISAGSTPTLPFARADVATEYRPGTYIFGDRQQLGLGAMVRSEISLTVVATVIARHDDRLVLDAGGKALGRDAPRWLPGHGELADIPGALITKLYDHHAVLEAHPDLHAEIGDRVAIVPNNANSVMALLRSAWLSDDGQAAVELNPHPDR